MASQSHAETAGILEGLRRYIIDGSVVRRNNIYLRVNLRDNLNGNEARRHNGEQNDISGTRQDNQFIQVDSVYHSAHGLNATFTSYHGNSNLCSWRYRSAGIRSNTVFARQVESALAQTDKGLVEAALSMGSSPFEVIFRVYLRESIAPLTRAITITIISLLGLTAMAGAVGAGGLGDFAIRYGHDRNMIDITWVTVIVLVTGVSVVQWLGEFIARRNTH